MNIMPEDDDNDKDLEYFFEQKISIKEIDKGIILIGLTKYLIESKIQKQTCNNRIIKKLDDFILDINKLSDKRIIIFTNKNIIILNKIDKEYIINNEYQIKDNWKT